LHTDYVATLSCFAALSTTGKEPSAYANKNYMGKYNTQGMTSSFRRTEKILTNWAIAEVFICTRLLIFAAPE
jgi:hypothetical protein